MTINSHDWLKALISIQIASKQLMALTSGLAKSNMFLRSCRRAKHVQSGISEFLATAEPGPEAESSGAVLKGREKGCWVPHPRTGIYFPLGHEWVMEDVPEGAAKFSQTCWFRNNAADVVTVDYPNPDVHAPLHTINLLSCN